MIFFFPLCRERQADTILFFYLQTALKIIFKPNDHKLILCVHCRPYDPLFRVFHLLTTFNCIIEGISKDCAQIHHVHKIEQLPVGHTGKIDIFLRALHIFSGQDRIKHFISCFTLRFVQLKSRLYLFQITFPLVFITLRADYSDLVFQIMVLAVQKFYITFRKLILFKLRSCWMER